MRVSNAMIMKMVHNAHAQAAQAAFEPQERIITGRRVVEPADDLIASARIMDLDRSLDALDMFGRTRERVGSNFEHADSVMANIAEMATEAHGLAIQMSSDGVTAEERLNAATRMGLMMNDFYGMANHQRADGTYLFNGVDDQNPPYVDDGTGTMVFQGTDIDRNVEVSPGLFQDVTLNATEIFENSGFVAALGNFEQALLNDDRAGIQQAIDDFELAITDFGNKRADIGHKLTALQTAEDLSLDLELQYITERGQLRDVDLAAEITRLTAAENAMQSIFETTKRFMSMNIGNFL